MSCRDALEKQVFFLRRTLDGAGGAEAYPEVIESFASFFAHFPRKLPRTDERYTGVRCCYTGTLAWGPGHVTRLISRKCW